MGLGQILVVVDGSKGCHDAFKASIRLGNIFKSHIEVLYVEEPKQAIIPTIGEGMGISSVEGIISQHEEVSKQMKHSSKALFEAVCKEENLNIIDADGDLNADELTVSWKCITGHEAPEVAHRGRLYDLVVMPRPEEGRGGVDSIVLEAALFETGRPVMVTPTEVWGTGLGQKIAIAWDGSREAAHSVAMSMPLLCNAKDVTVFSVTSDIFTPDPGELIRYLSAHNITAKSKMIDVGETDTRSVLLASLRKADIDLVVMGAFSHSPLSEFLFGGVTRTMLADLAVPVILAH